MLPCAQSKDSVGLKMMGVMGADRDTLGCLQENNILLGKYTFQAACLGLCCKSLSKIVSYLRL